MVELVFAIIGKKLTHSYSPDYYNSFFYIQGKNNCKYIAIEMDDIQEIVSILERNPHLQGFNVTVPFKEQIIPFLHKISPTAQKIGAVNVVKVIRNENGIQLHGYNTDYKGFSAMFKLINKTNIQNCHALILGSGGASKCVQHVLHKEKVPFIVVSRNKKKNELTYSELTDEIIQNHNIIINCTPLGMYPQIHEKPPINYEAIGSSHYLLDLIYNPEQTLFLKEGLLRSAKVMNGMHMFMIQAKESLKIYF